MLTANPQPGSIVIAEVACFDGKTRSKRRPCLVLSVIAANLIAVPLSTSKLRGFHETITVDPAECPSCGLKEAGVLKVSQPVSFTENEVVRELGSVPAALRSRAACAVKELL